MTKNTQPIVGVIMGSESDFEVMMGAIDVLNEFGIPHEMRVISAHRRAWDALEYGKTALERGLRVIIAGAGGAAHLPGVLAGSTPLPVIGVPVSLQVLDGLDSLLSMVQMPAGVPVATVAVGGARNAGLLAVRMLALAEPELLSGMLEFQETLRERSIAQDVMIQERLRARESGND
jgi:5-(carboxyamino)imidazole ribonucleotide mutase